jgi:hypothetical protein
MFGHIDFSLCLRLHLLLVPIFFRTDLYITVLLIIKLAKPYIFPLFYFFYVFAELQDLFVVLVGAVIDDVLHVVLNNKGFSL